MSITEKPEVQEGFEAIFNGAEWVICKSAQKPLADDSLTTEKAVKRGEIMRRLQQIDSESARPLREISAALAIPVEAPAFALQKIAALETEAGRLRQELAGL